ncbi:neuropeptide CCHamide-1 receptor-like [Lycorma delicatula]|uniref:neuropeptide CCHamide-1 receptor-like n=1 Tax=Lycorma delicatula TaxID=130591 RepID=UPI003F519C00
MMEQQSENATVWNIDDEFQAFAYEDQIQIKIYTDDKYLWHAQRQERDIFFVLFVLIILLVGSLDNGTLILIFARHRIVRNEPNTYILNLAISGLLVIVTYVPFTSLIFTTESWPWGELVCRLVEASKGVSIGVSVFTIIALSAERYRAIVNPIRRHVTKPLNIITAIWLFSLLLTLPAAAFSKVYSITLINNEIIEYCTPFPKQFGLFYAKIIVLFNFIAYCVIPLSIIGVLYVLMARHLMLTTRNMPGEQQGHLNQIKARKRVASVVLAFVIIYIICFLPTNICMLWVYFYNYYGEELDAYWKVYRIIRLCLILFYSCTNPIALYFMSKEFRKQFNRYLF